MTSVYGYLAYAFVGYVLYQVIRYVYLKWEQQQWQKEYNRKRVRRPIRIRHDPTPNIIDERSETASNVSSLGLQRQVFFGNERVIFV